VCAADDYSVQAGMECVILVRNLELLAIGVQAGLLREQDKSFKASITMALHSKTFDDQNILFVFLSVPFRSTQLLLGRKAKNTEGKAGKLSVVGRKAKNTEGKAGKLYVIGRRAMR